MLDRNKRESPLHGLIRGGGTDFLLSGPALHESLGHV